MAAERYLLHDDGLVTFCSTVSKPCALSTPFRASSFLPLLCLRTDRQVKGEEGVRKPGRAMTAWLPAVEQPRLRARSSDQAGDGLIPPGCNATRPNDHLTLHSYQGPQYQISTQIIQVWTSPSTRATIIPCACSSQIPLYPS